MTIAKLMSTTSANMSAALNLAKKSTGIRNGYERLTYPGSDARELSRWFLSKKNSPQELIILDNLVPIYAYRLAAGVRPVDNGRRLMCLDRLHRSSRHTVQIKEGVYYQRVNAQAIDLYADTFGEPETWFILRVLRVEPLLDVRNKPVVRLINGKPQPEMRYYHRFVEIPSGDPVLESLEKINGMKFFQNRPEKLIGAHITVEHTGARGEYLGRWTVKTRDRGDGSVIPTVTGMEELKRLLSEHANKVLTDADKKLGRVKLYLSTVDEAYPVASVDKQRLMLQEHNKIITDHPEFTRKFPLALTINDSTDDGGTEVDVGAIDGDNAEPTFDDGSTDDGSTDDGSTDDSSTDEVEAVNAEADVDTDAADADSAEDDPAEDGDDAAEETDSAADVEAESADAPEENSTDDMQDDQAVDLDGDASAFDYVDEEDAAPEVTKPATKATTKPATKPTTKPAAKPAASKPAPKATKKK